jgi:hypothetical protein
LKSLTTDPARLSELKKAGGERGVHREKEELEIIPIINVVSLRSLRTPRSIFSLGFSPAFLG